MARRRRLKPWTVAVPLAAGINLALLALLAFTPEPAPVEVYDPVVVAFELSPRENRVRPRNLVRRAGAAPSNRAPLPALPSILPPVDETEGDAPTGSWIDPEWRVNRGAWDGGFSAGPGQLDLRQALRARAACLSNAPLTAEERERCRGFWDEAAARGTARGVPRALNLDPRGDYREEAEPYLQRMPTNGCKPRAGGTPQPQFGNQGVAAGITCAFQF
ncbi:MAG: hypothetical protein J0I28_09995 [Caulobacterales bacterium]|nr:hypothetical protein [Caulobacterales bacterium]